MTPDRDVHHEASMQGRVRVQVHDAHGHLKREDVYLNLWTNNWRKMMAHIWADGGKRQDVSVTDTSGIDHTFSAWDVNTADFNVSTTGHGVRPVIGDGGGASVVPSRGDTSMVNRVKGSDPVTPDEGGSIITWATSFINDTGASWTIREVGFVFLCQVMDGTAQEFLIMHVATADTPVADGESITVSYELTIP